MEGKEFRKSKKYLICVDSDGCAMDTMDIKHFLCFGPCMIKVWDLWNWEEVLLRRWNEINLYSMTRGINRFKGLAMALVEINAGYQKIDGIEALQSFIELSPELSNTSLKHEIDKTGSECLKKALSWSEQVNQEITTIPDKDKKPFEGVDEALAYGHQYADIAIVSSANRQAVLDEWDLYGLLDHTDGIFAQDSGSKAHCIKELLEKGYERDHVLMVGDAPGDLQAGKDNQVLFYPILVKQENQSWRGFKDAVQKLVNGDYAGRFQEDCEQNFLLNLKRD